MAKSPKSDRRVGPGTQHNPVSPSQSRICILVVFLCRSEALSRLILRVPNYDCRRGFACLQDRGYKINAEFRWLVGGEDDDGAYSSFLHR